MTRDEAIYLLKTIVTSNPNDRVALDMAIYDMGIIDQLKKERDDVIEENNSLKDILRSEYRKGK